MYPRVDPLLSPFSANFFATDFVQRALLGGSLVAILCGVVGTWVVIRGMAFLGEALGHGMLPGVALATVLGLPAVAGGAVSAIAMSLGIGALQRRGRLSYDTSIGLLFVSMLALGVIIISHSGSFATDATAILFGDILAITPTDLIVLGIACAIGLAVAAAAHRSLVALALDGRIAAVLGLRPRLAQATLVGLVTLAVVASYQAVGSLLVVGLLLAPAVAASHWTTRIPTRMLLAALFGVAAVFAGLLVSWYAGTAAGASVAASAITIAGLSATARALATRRARRTLAVAAGALTLTLAGCSSPAAPEPSASSDGHGAISGAAEVAEPQLGLTSVDPGGGVTHLDLLDERVTEIGTIGAPSAMHSDGRYLFATTDAGLEIVDSGVWTWDHIDHFHYYRASPRLIGTVPGDGPVTVATTNLSTTGGTGVFFAGSGEAVLLDTTALSKGEIRELFRIDGEARAGMVVPVGSYALVTESAAGASTTVVGYDADGEPVGISEPCREASGTITTRVGAVIGCSDGALLATIRGDELHVERIPYPAGTTAPPATSFANREGRPTVARLAGNNAVWVLDTRELTWTLLAAPAPLVQVTAVDDDDENLLALTADGRVVVMSAADGSVRAQTDPLVSASLTAAPAMAAPVLIADQQRAYLSGPLEHRLFEIDFADAARIARSFDTSTEPAFVAETGR